MPAVNTTLIYGNTAKTKKNLTLKLKTNDSFYVRFKKQRSYKYIPI